MNKKITKDTAFRILLSIALAFLLWAFAITNTDPMLTQKYTSIPVTYQNTESLDTNNLLAESDIDTIDVKLYGRTVQVSKIKASDIEAVADLSNITKEGSYTVEILIKGLPQNVNVIDISPKYLTIEVSKMVEDKKNISIETTGSLSGGYAVLGHTEDVSYATVSGSSSAASQVAQIKGIVDVAGKNKDFSSTVTLVAYDKNGSKINNVKINPSQVNVAFSIGITKSVDLKAVSSGNCADGYAVEKITLNPSQITIAGKEAAVSEISSLSTIKIDVTNRSASFAEDTDVALPDGIIIIGQPNVSANVSIQQYKEITYTYNTLQVRNTPAGLSCDLSSFTGLNMTVKGFSSALTSITKDSIKIYIDLTGLTAGTHTVPINYELPPNISVKSMDKTSVTIILSAQ